MAKYLIHAYPKRMWYVENYLIPSMLKQGISAKDIRVYNDEKHLGNLKACMEAFASCTAEFGGTWHLQDDVCISKDFKQKTETYNAGIVCGFSSLKFDGDIEEKKGFVSREKAYFSFPCIRIPNEWARECAEYVNTQIIGNPEYEEFWKDGVNDDWAFRKYLAECHTDCEVLNLVPCIVDHIDFLIGGGSNGQQRQYPIRAQYWEDDDVIEELKKCLNNGG